MSSLKNEIVLWRNLSRELDRLCMPPKAREQEQTCPLFGNNRDRETDDRADASDNR